MNVSWADTIRCSLPLAHSIMLLTVNAVVGVLGYDLETCLFVWPLLQIPAYADLPTTFCSA